MHKKLTLAELREYALFHADELFEVTNSLHCLACELVRQRHPSSDSVFWSTPDKDGIGCFVTAVRGWNKDNVFYTIPDAYGRWCLDICRKGLSLGERLFTGKEIANAIERMM